MDGFAQQQPHDEDQGGEGERLKCLLARQREHRTETARRQHRGKRHQNDLCHLAERDPAKQGRHHEQGDSREQHDEYIEYAGQQFSQHQFRVVQPGHQQENEGAPVLFLRDSTGRSKCGQKDQQRELKWRQDLEEHGSEASHVAHVPDDLSSRDDKPGRPKDNQKN